MKFDEQNFDKFTVVFTGKYYRKKVRRMNYWPFVKFIKFSPVKLKHYMVTVIIPSTFSLEVTSTVGLSFAKVAFVVAISFILLNALGEPTQLCYTIFSQ